MFSSVSSSVNSISNRYQYRGSANSYVLVEGGTVSVVGSKFVVSVDSGSGNASWHTRTINGQTFRYLGSS